MAMAGVLLLEDGGVREHGGQTPDIRDVATSACDKCRLAMPRRSPPPPAAEPSVVPRRCPDQRSQHRIVLAGREVDACSEAFSRRMESVRREHQAR
jgi:hypothetical protein